MSAKNKKIFAVLFFLVCGAVRVGAAPIDLRDGWFRVGTAGTWNVSPDGTSVLQTLNTASPTFFLSPDDYINTEFNGKFQVRTNFDDDFIGFVFGYNNLNNFYLFDWKQYRQTWGGQTGEDGFRLSRISNYSNANFWGHTGTGIELLAYDYGTTAPGDRGWANWQEYDFTLLYQENRIKITIDGGTFVNETIFDITGTFGTGKFGFYNYSQANVMYQGFTEDDVPPTPIPEPSTMLLLGSGLIGLAGIKKRFKK